MYGLQYINVPKVWQLDIHIHACMCVCVCVCVWQQ